MIVREAVMTILQKAVPVTMSVTAGIAGHQKHGGRIPFTAGYAFGGFMVGWLAQRTLFDALEHASGPGLPTKDAKLPDQAVGALPPAPAKPPAPMQGVEVAQPQIGSPANDIKPPKSGNGTTVVFHKE